MIVWQCHLFQVLVELSIKGQALETFWVSTTRSRPHPPVAQMDFTAGCSKFLADFFKKNGRFLAQVATAQVAIAASSSAASSAAVSPAPLHMSSMQSAR